MPYASGEVPVVGDYVKNQWEQPGTVLEVCLAGGNFPHDQISVRWDDGGTDLPLTPAVEFTLVSRVSQSIAVSSGHIPPGGVDGGEREISQTEERTTRLEVVTEVPPPVVVVACSTCKGCFYWPHGLALPAYCPHCGAKNVTTPPQA